MLSLLVEHSRTKFKILPDKVLLWVIWMFFIKYSQVELANGQICFELAQCILNLRLINRYHLGLSKARNSLRNLQLKFKRQS